MEVGKGTGAEVQASRSLAGLDFLLTCLDFLPDLPEQTSLLVEIAPFLHAEEFCTNESTGITSSTETSCHVGNGVWQSLTVTPGSGVGILSLLSSFVFLKLLSFFN